METQLDPDVLRLAKSIRQVETGNRPVQGASGELASRYQFMPGTWKGEAKRILGDENAPLTLENENKVAYTRIKEKKDAGWKPDQIASWWNSGGPDYAGKVGVNKMGVKYDVPGYVNKVKGAYENLKQAEGKTEGVQEVSAQPEQKKQGILAGLGIGAAKGLGSTIAGAEKLGGKILDLPLGLLGMKPQVSTGLLEEAKKKGTFTPKTGAEKVGFGAEQVAEFLLPIPGGAKAKAATKLAQGAKGLLGRSALEAVETAGKTAIQTGGDVGETAKAAAIGGGFGLAGGLLGKALKGAAPKLVAGAEKSMTQALAPTTKYMKLKAEKVVPGLVKRGFTGLTRGDLVAKAAESLAKSTDELEAVIQTIPATSRISMRPVLKSLMESKAAYMVDDVVIEPQAVKAIDNMIATIKEFGTKASFESVRALRQILDKSVAKSKGFLMDEVGTFSIAAKREASNAIRSELAKKFPNLAKVNAEYSFWRNVDEILTETMTRTAGQSKPLGEQLLGAAGAAGGLASGGLTGAITGTIVMSNLRKAMTSAGWRTASAQIKSRLADALASNRLEEAMAIINKIVAAGATNRD